ncbi:NapC/NirT family cytochrome c [Tropicimonas sp.]|uniref:NapC/NirT family cytochrome c n=1 Tax=Tropicimonas sp. TaxID=2067044 RepID=UPI003A8BFE73
MAGTAARPSDPLAAPRRRRGALFFAAFGVFIGLILWGGLDVVMSSTENTGFCISCHEMRDTPYAEYQNTAHHTNASGVVASCPDCHVPKPLVPRIVDHIYALGELYSSFRGKIDTPEKYEAHRLEMANAVWDFMVATDSRECRGCHSEHAMDFSRQDPEAAEQMQAGFEKGETCIDCHKGIAHKLPDMTAGYKSQWTDMLAAAAALKAEPGKTYYSLETAEFYAEPPGDGTPRAGRLLSDTPVEVIERSGDKLKIRISGWRQENADRAVFTLPGKRIFVAALDPAGIELARSGETRTDPDTGQVWAETTLEVWLAPGALTDDPDALMEYGAELYRATCANCHAAPAPDHYVANQWIGVMNSMKREISISDEQYRFLQKYLQLLASDVAGGHAPG